LQSWGLLLSIGVHYTNPPLEVYATKESCLAHVSALELDPARLSLGCGPLQGDHHPLEAVRRLRVLSDLG